MRLPCTEAPFDISAEVSGLRVRARVEFGSGPETSEEAVLLAPGLGSPELAGLRHHLASLGRTAISFEQPRVNYVRGFGRVEELRPRTIEAVVAQARKECGIGKLALVGHSLAGIDVVRVAQMADDPDTVSSVELMASAGFTGEDFWEIAKRLRANILAEANLTNVPYALRVARHVLNNPLQLLQEGIYGSRADLREAASGLSKELPFGLLQFRNDGVFSPVTVDAAIDGLGLRSYTTAEPPHACHISPLDGAAQTARVLDRVLDGHS